MWHEHEGHSPKHHQLYPLGPHHTSCIPRLIFAVVFSIFFLVAVTANVIMILLIHVDSHLHTPMYFLLSQLSWTQFTFA